MDFVQGHPMFNIPCRCKEAFANFVPLAAVEVAKKFSLQISFLAHRVLIHIKKKIQNLVTAIINYSTLGKGERNTTLT